MAMFEYLLWVTLGLFVLWLVGRIDDWLIKKEQR